MHGASSLIAILVAAFLLSEVPAMKHTAEKPRQCWRRHPDYRWDLGEMPGVAMEVDADKPNPNYKKKCSMLIGPGAGASDQAIDIENDCVLENCTEEQTTCVRNRKQQEKNQTYMIVLEGCDKPPAEVPDMDEKNEYGMAGKLWDEYCENLLINHMRPVYKVDVVRCYCPNHREDQTELCNKAKPLQTTQLSILLSFIFNLLVFRAIS